MAGLLDTEKLDGIISNYQPGALAQGQYWKDNFNISGAGTPAKFAASQGYDIQPPSHIKEAIKLSEDRFPSNGLMDATIKHETHYGTHPNFLDNKVGGVTQMNRATFEDTKRLRGLGKYRAAIKDEFGISWGDVQYEDLANNPFLATLAGRMYYATNPDPIPEQSYYEDMQALPGLLPEKIRGILGHR